MLPEKITGSCATTAMFRRSATGSSSAISTPSKRMAPFWASKKRSISWKTVDLPAPLRPHQRHRLAAATASEKSFSALKSGRVG